MRVFDATMGASSPVASHESDSAFLREITDLTAPGHYTHISQWTLQKRLWRFRTSRLGRPTRRSKVAPHHHGEDEHEESESGSGNSDSCCGLCSWWRRDTRSKEEHHHRHQSFGFAMTTGPKHFFQRIVRQHPVLAMCMWAFLFICEATMVVLYVVQTTRSYDVSWVQYEESEFTRFFYAHTILSLVLLSQLVFAYSVSPFTIAVVLVTSCYQLITFVVAFGKGLGWVSRLYVPLFLRCWPMRQYFLFLLDSFAMLTPRNHRLDLIRLAAGPISFFLTMFFTWGCIFHIHQVLRGTEINIGVAMYWLMVTVSTVGFGDVVPQGRDGRAIAIVIIFLFLANMPSWIAVVISTRRILREFPTYNGRRDHFLVYGHVRYEDAVSILEEVFTLYPMKSVCFCNNKFSRDVMAIGRHPRYRMRSKFMQVGVLDKGTLRRMQVSEAAAVIILPTRDGAPTTRDDDVMLSSVVFQRHAPHLPQYLRLRFGLHARLLRERKKTMIDQSMKTIMATALLLPGVVPFLVNLVRISSACGTSSPTLWKVSEMNNWKALYEYSRRNIFGTCPVPWYFVHLPLMRVVRYMKLHDVLVVGVEEGSRKLMRLDLDYVLEEGDTLLVLHERGSDSVTRALVALEPQGGAIASTFAGASSPVAGSASLQMHGSPGASQQDLFEFELEDSGTPMDDSKLFYPFNRSFDLLDAAADETLPILHGGKSGLYSSRHRTSHRELNRYETVQDLRRQLMQASFVEKKPGGVPLNELPLGGSLAVLKELLNCYNAAVPEVCGTGDSRERLEHQINDILAHVAEEYVSGAGDKDPMENFLFIDQVSSFLQPPMQSIYDKHLNDVVSRYELLQMMQCIHAIHSQSRMTLLSSQKLNRRFLHWWEKSFGSPLRYIRGLSTLESHLDYAITQSGGISKLRGILLYCSQLGSWDFADVPLITVENNIRALLEWAGTQQKNESAKVGKTASVTEQNVVVELQSFESCISVTPHHTDLVWRRRGEEHFQDSLAFMMGRCFSSNMLQTIFIHAHRDHRIMQFFEMVLCLETNGDYFDVDAWMNRKKKSPTLFQVCGNQLLHFQTFGDAFSFLLSRRSWVVIGVFRQFPKSEGLPGLPRYFITNPPTEMPLRADDVMYALSLSSATGEKTGP